MRRVVAVVVAAALLVACTSGDDDEAEAPLTRAPVTGSGSAPPPVSPTSTTVPDADDRVEDLPQGDAGASPPPELAPPATAAPPVPPPSSSPPVSVDAPPQAITDIFPAQPGMRLRYVVVPHPDDEFQVWSLLSRDTSHYLVFILLTRGEQSQFCDGSGMTAGGLDQGLLGERMPTPQPFLGPGLNCADQRLDAWVAFLDAMASADAALDLPRLVGGFQGALPERGEPPSKLIADQRVVSVGYRLWVGPRTARFAFDLGDGDVTEEEVLWAVETVRALRDRLPVHDEDDIVAAAYFNDRHAGAIRYEHVDHETVQETLFLHDFGLPGPQWGRAVPGDPRLVETRMVPPDVYCAAMCVVPEPIDPSANPRAVRAGIMQRTYGWLAEQYWAGAERPSGSIFSQQQGFWRAH